ncbi:hypothetical protein Nepgr_000787 [Nepenthes gracilis]|uniref:Ferredoxin thioredoxin reductase alpha chain domain-containing protein n=1 Tax=Nepenthes gracilis TaxID=150966 RepID=A0AAD3P405_NEPGR|nr:hypothetical protein Nepgr_000787 [Nepenthes gracilis]
MALTSSSTAKAAAATAIAVPHSPPPFLINRTLVRSRISSSSFNFSLVKSSPSLTNAIHYKRRPRFISCDVALKPNSMSSVGDDLSSLSSSGEVSGTTDEDEELKRKAAKVGARVRVKVPLKVYHVPRLPEVDVTGLEGELKQFVGLWKVGWEYMRLTRFRVYTQGIPSTSQQQ